MVDGATAALMLRDLGPLRGRVITNSGREVLLEWPERQAVVGLKTFAFGPHARAIALDVSVWDGRSNADAELTPGMDAAVERLLQRLTA